MGCGWEVLHGMWLVVCYDLDFFCVTMGFARILCKFNQTMEKKQFHALQKLAKPTVYGLLCQF